MTRADADRLDDIRAAIARCLAYRDHLDSDELGSMAYDAVLRNLAVIGEAVKALLIRDIVDNQLAPLLDDVG